MPDEIDAAVMIAYAGLDVNRFLNCPDPVELVTMQTVAARVIELRAEERQDLAVRIRNQIVEAFDG